MFSKISKRSFEFGDNQQLDLIVVQHHQSEAEPVFLFEANPIAQFLLGYKRPNKTELDHVDPEWKVRWCDLVDTKSTLYQGSPIKSQLPHNWHPDTWLLKEAGIYALIVRSKQPEVKKFQKWLFEDVLPELRRTGDNRTPSASLDYMHKYIELLNEVVPLRTELAVMKANHERDLMERDKQLAEVQRNFERQIMEYKNRENKMQLTVKDLTCSANMTLTQLGVNALLAQDNIRENEALRSSIESVSERVVPDMSDRPDKEPYVACYERNVDGGKRIRVTRQQFKEVEQCDKMMQKYRENPTQRPKSKRYGWLKDSDKFLQIRCPNAVTLWAKIRHTYPHVVFGMRFTNRMKTEIIFLDENELRQKYRDHVDMCTTNHKTDSGKIEDFKALNLTDENDAVAKCLTPSIEAKMRVNDIVNHVIEQIRTELRPKDEPKRYDNASTYSPDQIVNCVKNYGIINLNVIKFCNTSPFNNGEPSCSSSSSSFQCIDNVPYEEQRM